MPFQSKKTVSKTFTFDRIDVLFSVLALLDASIGMIRIWFHCHNHTCMISHQLWAFLSKSRSSLYVDNISWGLYMRHYFCSQFINFGTAAHFMSKTSEKLLGMSRTICRHHQQPLQLWFDDYPNHFLHCFNVFICCWRARATRTSIVIDIFSACLKPVIELVFCL